MKLWASIWYPDKDTERKRHGYENGFQKGTYNHSKLNRNTRLSSFHKSICQSLYDLLKPKTIIDPCCGLGVRVVTALERDIKAIGYDISPKTISNVRNLYPEYESNFFVNDSRSIPYSENSFELVFTSPPYFNIEKYESTEGQLSDIKNYNDFLIQYEKLIKESIRISSKFVAFVVGNFRYRKKYHNFVYDTETLFLKNGATIFDKIILGHDSNTHPMSGNKCLKYKHTRVAHEELLIFKKSDNKTEEKSDKEVIMNNKKTLKYTFRVTENMRQQINELKRAGIKPGDILRDSIIEAYDKLKY